MAPRRRFTMRLWLAGSSFILVLGLMAKLADRLWPQLPVNLLGGFLIVSAVLGFALAAAALLSALCAGGRRGLEHRARRFLGIAIAWVVIAASTSEVAFRAALPHGMSFSANFGPIVARFSRSYTLNALGSRGPLDMGPKSPGVVRILIQGDSITFGQGIRHESDVYPARLLAALNGHGAVARYEMAVLAWPGFDLDDHLVRMSKYGPQIAPDIIIYQWFPNDLVTEPLPQFARRGLPWSKSNLHRELVLHSYAYFFLNYAWLQLISRGERPYGDRLRDVYTEGMPEWQRFTTLFHEWADLARKSAPRIILLLFPLDSEPGEDYSLGRIHDQMRQLAAAHGIEVVDMRDSLRDLRTPKELRAGPFDAHPSALVHRRIAEALETEVSREP